jgi:hypothetical protein
MARTSEITHSAIRWWCVCLDQWWKFSWLQHFKVKSREIHILSDFLLYKSLIYVITKWPFLYQTVFKKKCIFNLYIYQWEYHVIKFITFFAIHVVRFSISIMEKIIQHLYKIWHWETDYSSIVKYVTKLIMWYTYWA